MKVLVTGSRGWRSKAKIKEVLRGYQEQARTRGEGLIVIHGDCPKGADLLAKYACKELGIQQIPMPADWARYKRAAGPRRNAQMLLEHPDVNVVAAFRASGKSSGTDDMMTKAKAADIQIDLYHEA